MGEGRGLYTELYSLPCFLSFCCSVSCVQCYGLALLLACISCLHTIELVSTCFFPLNPTLRFIYFLVMLTICGLIIWLICVCTKAPLKSVLYYTMYKTVPFGSVTLVRKSVLACWMNMQNTDSINSSLAMVLNYSNRKTAAERPCPTFYWHESC